MAYALRHRSLGKSLDSTAELLAGSRSKVFARTQPLRWTTLQALKMPYAPAIAIGTIFSFFATVGYMNGTMHQLRIASPERWS